MKALLKISIFLAVFLINYNNHSIKHVNADDIYTQIQEIHRMSKEMDRRLEEQKWKTELNTPGTKAYQMKENTERIIEHWPNIIKFAICIGILIALWLFLKRFQKIMKFYLSKKYSWRKYLITLTNVVIFTWWILLYRSLVKTIIVSWLPDISRSLLFAASWRMESREFLESFWQQIWVIIRYTFRGITIKDMIIYIIINGWIISSLLIIKKKIIKLNSQHTEKSLFKTEKSLFKTEKDTKRTKINQNIFKSIETIVQKLHAKIRKIKTSSFHKILFWIILGCIIFRGLSKIFSNEEIYKYNHDYSQDISIPPITNNITETKENPMPAKTVNKDNIKKKNEVKLPMTWNDAIIVEENIISEENSICEDPESILACSLILDTCPNECRDKVYKSSKVCEELYWVHSYSDGTLANDWWYNCYCGQWYTWNEHQTECIEE